MMPPQIPAEVARVRKSKRELPGRRTKKACDQDALKCSGQPKENGERSQSRRPNDNDGYPAYPICNIPKSFRRVLSLSSRKQDTPESRAHG